MLKLRFNFINGDAMNTDTNNKYYRMLRSWWGRLLLGAFIGGFAASLISDPWIFLIGVISGAVIVYFLGEIK